MKYYFDFSSLDYDIEFFKSDEDLSYYIPSGVLHGPYDTITKAKKEANEIISCYIKELSNVKHSIRNWDKNNIKELSKIKVG